MSEFHDLAEQRLNHESMGESCWGNFGYWEQEAQYPKACQALAEKLAQAANLGEKSRVFDAGFGAGDQLLCWLERYKPAYLSGANISKTQTELAKTRLVAAGYKDAARALICGDAMISLQSMESGAQGFNTVVALDCAYHFPSRYAFLIAAEKAMVNGGCVAMTDIILGEGIFRIRDRALLRTMARLSQIPMVNLITASAYKQQWQQAGLAITQFDDITAQVFKPFGAWLNNYKKQYGSLESTFGWFKYDITARFLAWAVERDLLRYVVCAGVAHGSE